MMIRIRFGTFKLDERCWVLENAGEAVALRPKAFELLLHLARHRDRVVRREELIEVVWGGTRVGAGSLAGLVN
jgi:DNA-binding winged helix-turn-helix (wHTH) protein